MCPTADRRSTLAVPDKTRSKGMENDSCFTVVLESLQASEGSNFCSVQKIVWKSEIRHLLRCPGLGACPDLSRAMKEADDGSSSPRMFEAQDFQGLSDFGLASELPFWPTTCTS